MEVDIHAIKTANENDTEKIKNKLLAKILYMVPSREISLKSLTSSNNKQRAMMETKKVVVVVVMRV